MTYLQKLVLYAAIFTIAISSFMGYRIYLYHNFIKTFPWKYAIGEKVKVKDTPGYVIQHFSNHQMFGEFEEDYVVNIENTNTRLLVKVSQISK